MILCIAAWFFAGCDDSSELYSYPINKIGFLLAEGESKVMTKTFIYDGPEMERDTVYVRMRTMGFVSDVDRQVRLEQAEVTEEEAASTLNAVPGVHYIPFDDPEQIAMTVVRAGQVEAEIPIILLRDPSLETEQVALKIRIAENEEFQPFNQELSERIILFSDQPLQPAAWNESFVPFFGEWGPVKYRFMLDNTTPLWDDEFIESLLNDYTSLMFWQSRLVELLSAENARREEAGEGPLREAPALGETEGKLVSFP